MCESLVESVLHSTTGLTGDSVHCRTSRVSSLTQKEPEVTWTAVSHLLKPSNTRSSCLVLPGSVQKTSYFCSLLQPFRRTSWTRTDWKVGIVLGSGSSKVCLCLTAIMTVSMVFILTMLRQTCSYSYCRVIFQVCYSASSTGEPESAEAHVLVVFIRWSIAGCIGLYLSITLHSKPLKKQQRRLRCWSRSRTTKKWVNCTVYTSKPRSVTSTKVSPCSEASVHVLSHFRQF